MPSVLAFLLLPFSWLYAGVMAVRNWLYDVGWKESEAFAVPLINVGNLRVGGTGKTPHVAWLIEELLRQGHRPAVLSRGYGRSTRGPRLAGPADSAATVGDESWQYFQQFASRQVPVAVAEARRLGVRLLLQAHPKITVIVLDDAYQHRAVLPTLNVLLTELARPFYADEVLPAGRLRESRGGARRADVVIVTKCPPDLSAAAQAKVEQQIRHYSQPNIPVLFSAYEYAGPQPFSVEIELEARPLSTPTVSSISLPALLLTGIAQPGPLREHLESSGYAIQHHAVFADHHAFQPTDLATLRTHWQMGWPIFTTEKDATRLLAPALEASRSGLPFYTIPVRVAFLGDGGAALRGLLPPLPASNS
ncbi:tetraacyldisaccharide 4'-kinase [Hymenobacter sp. BT770]|uniref:tetraacyldisaccharide 4'-kinase n=1 Tax=Hymenobacter sp. BT770 TaxID=2886942 RepID=UPI001D110A91|nr:tetraacyldisaccharide 4'-kinase [Hymenobacter sp. BT770]MCC3154540.1 tetraacyldisaccharide 4'-kinase [Hymenobacter sp. BT770]MDO3416594.1 tetraacyldisaccharide 4'-kinase [Hymenobacter sp. BT770]